ncbi:MAG: D-2-hydroxyacid dehydrogenase [Hyphomicrobiales bacterium]|nr:D-2-hydroxyacid dehydrogenase [Alphaproteobacteria bacterium]
MTNVLIYDVRGPQYRALLAQRFPSVSFHIGHHMKDVEGVIADIDVIFGLGHHIPAELIAKAKNLKWVQALTTGTETLTAPGVLPPHVLLTSTRGIHGPQMSELAYLNMIALARDFKRNLRNQAEAKWDQYGQPILQGKTIVIVGLGLLAEHLAERCKMFGMTVVGISNGRAGAPHFDEVHPRSDLKPQAARADFLMLLVPYSPDTHHLIDRSVIAAMKPSAFLINLARGGVLDEAALIEHLQAGKIAGAGIDVFSAMPLPPDNPLWRMPNVIITPNIGGRSDIFIEQTMTVLEPNIAAFIGGRMNDMRNVIPH